ncbi:MAG: SprB repeat-containing protein [Chryseolinea sp.]
MKTYLLRLSMLGAIAAVLFNACSSDDPESADCSTLAVAVPDSGKKNPTDCASTDGSITATASGGKEPYQYSLNGGSFQSNPDFVNLSAGEYTVTVKDANTCETTSTAVTLAVAGVTVNFTAVSTNSGCKTNGGSITITATGGSGNFSYRVGSGSFGSSNVFDGQSSGEKSVTVKDNGDNCTITKSVMVASGTSYDKDIKPIIETSCAVSGCHVTGGAAPIVFNSVASVQSHAGQIKTVTANGSMPKSGTPLTQAQKDRIACWVDDGAPNN